MSDIRLGETRQRTTARVSFFAEIDERLAWLVPDFRNIGYQRQYATIHVARAPSEDATFVVSFWDDLLLFFLCLLLFSHIKPITLPSSCRT
jgi:hypothetical protein